VSDPLENLCGPGKSLKAEPADANEIAGLLRTGAARLIDARDVTLAPKFGVYWTNVMEFETLVNMKDCWTWTSE
jgi:hypothetical protein